MGILSGPVSIRPGGAGDHRISGRRPWRSFESFEWNAVTDDRSGECFMAVAPCSTASVQVFLLFFDSVAYLIERVGIFIRILSYGMRRALGVGVKEDIMVSKESNDRRNVTTSADGRFSLAFARSSLRV